MDQELRRHQWLYATLAGVPFIIHGALAIWMAICTKYDGPNATQIPTYAWPVAFAFLPFLSGITGLIIGKIFLWWWSDIRKQALRPAYTVVFVISWVIIFGFLGFFTFAMGFGAPPGPTTLEGFFGRCGLVLLNFLISTAIAFALCAATMTVAIMVLGLASTIEKRFAKKT
ncbi:MAG: hypothetical protein K2W95_26425 [Candidatus Obscuribacterales bacterium]|nr:hypothetical protein [Candidatus Obscuribacterales bacterium]